MAFEAEVQPRVVTPFAPPDFPIELLSPLRCQAIDAQNAAHVRCEGKFGDSVLAARVRWQQRALVYPSRRLSRCRRLSRRHCRRLRLLRSGGARVVMSLVRFQRWHADVLAEQSDAPPHIVGHGHARIVGVATQCHRIGPSVLVERCASLAVLESARCATLQ